MLRLLDNRVSTNSVGNDFGRTVLFVAIDNPISVRCSCIMQTTGKSYPAPAPGKYDWGGAKVYVGGPKMSSRPK
jgi:hypothetical protein